MEITIHQMLHGYEDGHNYIRGSIYLSSPKDMDTIASLSDWSEYVNTRDDSSYLSAYPLKESGYYVIARTWYAEEMKRPGCVWTHSILIPMGAMNAISDYKAFETFFKRPIVNEYDSYSDPIKYDLSTEVKEKHLDELQNSTGIPYIIKDVLTGETPCIYEVETRSETYRFLCLMLMNVLPTGVLMNLSFCSGTNGLRALGGKPFDVQFTILQNQFVKSLFSEEKNIEDGFKYSSLYVKNEILSLGKLVRLFERDLDSDYSKYNSLCELILLINTDNESKDLREQVFSRILHIIETVYPNPNEGTLIKNRFLSQSITSLFVKDAVFIYQLLTTDLYLHLKKDTVDLENRVANLANDTNNHAEFVKLLIRLFESGNINDWGENLVSRVDTYLNDEDLNELISSNFETYLSLATLCPSILNNGSWEGLSVKGIKDLFYLFQSESVIASFRRWNYLLEIILNQCIDTDSKLAELLSKKCPDFVSTVMDSLYKNFAVLKMTNVLDACSRNQNLLLRWISGKENYSEPTLSYLANVINPNSIEVKNLGAKAFYGFTAVSRPMPLEYYVFLFVLSFNWYRDMFAIEYLHQSFYPIHKSLAEGTMREELWKVISPFTADVPAWQNWDKCKKLRKAVVKRIVDVGLYEDYLQHYTLDADLNKKLLKIYRKYKD